MVHGAQEAIDLDRFVGRSLKMLTGVRTPALCKGSPCLASGTVKLAALITNFPASEAIDS